MRNRSVVVVDLVARLKKRTARNEEAPGGYYCPRPGRSLNLNTLFKAVIKEGFISGPRGKVCSVRKREC